MNLTLKRKPSKYDCTIGELSIDGVMECYTLEDTVRDGHKIDGCTAIPAGKYDVIIDQSVRFKRPMPHILNVPGFTGIRIHAGTTAADTGGCVIVGQTHGVESVGHSRVAFGLLFAKLEAALDRNERITLEII